MDMGLSKLWEFVMDREVLRAVIHGAAKSQTWLSDWTELNWILQYRKNEFKITMAIITNNNPSV